MSGLIQWSRQKNSNSEEDLHFSFNKYIQFFFISCTFRGLSMRVSCLFGFWKEEQIKRFAFLSKANLNLRKGRIDRDLFCNLVISTTWLHVPHCECIMSCMFSVSSNNSAASSGLFILLPRTSRDNTSDELCPAALPPAVTQKPKTVSLIE